MSKTKEKEQQFLWTFAPIVGVADSQRLLLVYLISGGFRARGLRLGLDKIGPLRLGEHEQETTVADHHAAALNGPLDLIADLIRVG